MRNLWAFFLLFIFIYFWFEAAQAAQMNENSEKMSETLEKNHLVDENGVPNTQSNLSSLVDDDLQSRHVKGCKCRKSNCLKRYCECFLVDLELFKIECLSLCAINKCSFFRRKFNVPSCVSALVARIVTNWLASSWTDEHWVKRRRPIIIWWCKQVNNIKDKVNSKVRNIYRTQRFRSTIKQAWHIMHRLINTNKWTRITTRHSRRAIWTTFCWTQRAIRFAR